MRTSISVVFLALLTSLNGVARADIDDEKPWDWPHYNYVLRTKNGDGVCDAVAKDMKAPALQCAFDKDAWQAHIKTESKVEKIRDRNHTQPANCDGSGFQAFRGIPSNGSWPSDDDATTEEFRSLVTSMTCTFDNTEKDPFITYDAARKNLVVHLTRKQTWNSNWVIPALRDGELKKRFPLLDKHFRKRE